MLPLFHHPIQPLDRGDACRIRVWQIVKMFKPSAKDIPEAMWRLKFVFTVSITLTGGVFCAVLAPTTPGGVRQRRKRAHSRRRARVRDRRPLCRQTRRARLRHRCLALVPLIYYLAFATIGFVLNWTSATGGITPYFFLKLDVGPPACSASAAAGNTSMGTFWWILVLIALVSRHRARLCGDPQTRERRRRRQNRDRNRGRRGRRGERRRDAGRQCERRRLKRRQRSAMMCNAKVDEARLSTMPRF